MFSKAHQLLFARHGTLCDVLRCCLGIWDATAVTSGLDKCCVMFCAQFVNKRSTKYSPGVGPPVPQECPETGSAFQIGGPFWAGPLHDPAWIHGLLDSIEVWLALHNESLNISEHEHAFGMPVSV